MTEQPQPITVDIGAAVAMLNEMIGGPALVAAQAEIERLQRLLNGRNAFIVNQGLWQDFVDSLPSHPPNN